MGDLTLRKFLWLAIAVVVVVAAWTAGWFWIAGEARHQVQLLAEADGETAPRFTCGSFSISGFPFRFDAECQDATLVDQDLTVTFAGIKASLLAYNPTHLIFSGKGPFAYSDAFSGSQRRLDFSRLDGSVRVTAIDPIKSLSGEGWRLARFSVEGDDITVTDTVAADVLEASAKHVEAHLVDMPELLDKAAGTSALANYVAATQLTLPGLKVTSGNLTLEAQLTGLPTDLRDYAEPDPIRRWQAAGGALKLVRLSGSQPSPDEKFDVTGEFKLNGGGFAEGQLDYASKGVLDRLSEFVPAVQLAMLRGAPQGEGNFSNSLTVMDGQVKLLTFVFAQIPSLF